MDDLHATVFAVSPDIRYVALARGQEVTTRSRPDLSGASGDESDRFEELLVNPTLITLAGQRGDIDCGGLRYLVVGYGNFDQLVVPLTDGLLSIAFERGSDPTRHLPALTAVLEAHGHSLRPRAN